MSEWITWQGFDDRFIDQENEHLMVLNPLNSATALVNLKFKDGSVLDAVPAGDFDWGHCNSENDIVSYQLVKPRPHADLIRAWAYGAMVDRYDNHISAWVVETDPTWDENEKYRLHETVPETIDCYAHILREPANVDGWDYGTNNEPANVKFTFEGNNLVGVALI